MLSGSFEFRAGRCESDPCIWSGLLAPALSSNSVKKFSVQCACPDLSSCKKIGQEGTFMPPHRLHAYVGASSITLPTRNVLTVRYDAHPPARSARYGHSRQLQGHRVSRSLQPHRPCQAQPTPHRMIN
jgi:hypothetical protein